MNLKDFPGGKTIFVDANIFVLHFAGPEGLREECRDFLKQIEEDWGVLSFSKDDPEPHSVL